MIKDCPALCDYFTELVNTVSLFSYQVDGQGQTSIHEHCVGRPTCGMIFVIFHILPLGVWIVTIPGACELLYVSVPSYIICIILSIGRAVYLSNSHVFL